MCVVVQNFVCWKVFDSAQATRCSLTKCVEMYWLLYKTNRFHFAVGLYSDNVQRTSKRAENKEVRYEPQASSVTDVLTTF